MTEVVMLQLADGRSDLMRIYTALGVAHALSVGMPSEAMDLLGIFSNYRDTEDFNRLYNQLEKLLDAMTPED